MGLNAMRTPALRNRDLDCLLDAFRQFPWVREVRIFGSRSTGRARRASDIDLAISAPDATATEWSELAEAIDQTPIIYEFDLVRTERTDNTRLLEKISKEGIQIYP